MTGPQGEIFVSIGARYAGLTTGLAESSRQVDEFVSRTNSSLNRLTSVRSLMGPEQAAALDASRARFTATAAAAGTMGTAIANSGRQATTAALKLATVGSAIAGAGNLSVGTAAKVANVASTMSLAFGPTGIAVAALVGFGATVINVMSRTRTELENTRVKTEQELRDLLNAGDVEAIRKKMQDLWLGTPGGQFKDGIVEVQKALAALEATMTPLEVASAQVFPTEKSREVARLRAQLALLNEEFDRYRRAITDVNSVPFRAPGQDPVRITAAAPGGAAAPRLSQEQKDAEAMVRARYDYEQTLARDDFEKKRQLAVDYLAEISAVYGAQSAEYLAQLTVIERMQQEHDAQREAQFLDAAAKWAQYESEIRDIQRSNAEAYQADWEKALSTVTGAIERSFNGVIAGTLRVEDAFRNLGRNILLMMATNVAQALQVWIAAEITKRVMGVETARQTVMNSAVEAAARAWAATAAIPFVGPILAPIAAAGSFAGVLAFGANISSAAGGWDRIPGDQLAMVHKNEMVLPANLAESVRRMSTVGAEGAGGGDHFTVNISAMDAVSFLDALERNSSEMVTAITTLARNQRLAAVTG